MAEDAQHPVAVVERRRQLRISPRQLGVEPGFRDQRRGASRHGAEQEAVFLGEFVRVPRADGGDPDQFFAEHHRHAVVTAQPGAPDRFAGDHRIAGGFPARDRTAGLRHPAGEGMSHGYDLADGLFQTEANRGMYAQDLAFQQQ